MKWPSQEDQLLIRSVLTALERYLGDTAHGYIDSHYSPVKHTKVKGAAKRIWSPSYC